MVVAGAGNDWLDAGAGDDLALGGTGDDTVLAGDGNDLVVGNAGDDWISGGAGRDVLIDTGVRLPVWRRRPGGQDLLIGGITLYDTNLDALESVLAEWTSTADQAAHKSSLSNGTGDYLNGIALQAGVTVWDDSRLDAMIGGNDFDWFFADLDLADGDDEWTDLQHPHEQVEPLGSHT